MGHASVTPGVWAFAGAKGARASVLAFISVFISVFRSAFSSAFILACVLAAPAFGSGKITPPQPCGCGDLQTIERELEQQEYLGNLFGEWSGYLPNSVYNTPEMQERAAALLQLTFNGASSQAPRLRSRGASADLGTELTKESCPIVLYHYENGRPVIVADPPLKKGEKRKDVKLVQKVTPVDEAHYPANGQCAALVHYGFVHEQHHQKTCLDLFARGKTNLWDDAQFFAGDDAAAYRAGADVLRSERDTLRKRCEKRDGRWRGTVTYGWSHLDAGKEITQKGQDIVWPQATGWQTWGDNKSKRVRGTIDVASLEGPIKVTYTANYEWNNFHKGHVEYLRGECGWFKITDFLHDGGREEHIVGSGSGTADVNFSSNGRNVYLSFSTEPVVTKRTDRSWNYITGHCNKVLDQRLDETKRDPPTPERIFVKLEGKTDLEHPNDIHVVQIKKGEKGKEQEFIELRLRRVEP